MAPDPHPGAGQKTEDAMHTVLGAGGAIGDELLGELSKKGEQIRLVSRRVQNVPAPVQSVFPDLLDLAQTTEAVSGSTIVYLLVGLEYNAEIWKDEWPRIMHNAIESCKRARAKLIFFDNVYVYGKVGGRMTEETPFKPRSRKGEVRAGIATAPMKETKSGNVDALSNRKSPPIRFRSCMGLIPRDF